METQQCGIKQSKICYLGQMGVWIFPQRGKRLMLWSLGDRKQREEKILLRTKIPFPRLRKAMQPFLHVESCNFFLSPHGNTGARGDVQCPRCSSRTCCFFRSFSAGGSRTQSSAWPLLPHHLTQEQRIY